MRADPQNEMWLSNISSQASFVSSDCIVVIGFDHQWPPDVANRKEMLTKYLDAKEHIIEFDEGEAPRMRGIFHLYTSISENTPKHTSSRFESNSERQVYPIRL